LQADRRRDDRPDEAFRNFANGHTMLQARLRYYLRVINLKYTLL